MISCKICGDPLRGEVACCSICLTPHHADCWDYQAGCAVYGCGSTRAERFDFRQSSQDELLLALSTHVARALAAEKALVPVTPGAPPAAPNPGTEDLFRYKRGLFRSLQATLDKVKPALAEETRALFDEAAGTGGAEDEVYLSADVDLARRPSSGDVHEKRALMRRMAADESLVPRQESFMERLSALLHALWRALFPGSRE
jgi:hypothetical protein